MFVLTTEHPLCLALAQRVLLTSAAAQLSFSKFLELTFSASKLSAQCGHRLLADRAHFYASQGGVACMTADPVVPQVTLNHKRVQPARNQGSSFASVTGTDPLGGSD